MKKDKNTQLYFVALIPPENIYGEVQQQKEAIAKAYGCQAALKSPPHITLHMPFRWRTDREEKLIEVFSSNAQQTDSFEVTQSGYSAFPPRVVYINVEKTEELVQFRKALVRSMRRNLNLDNADYKDRPFHPHMTLAFRDLKKQQFEELWDKLKDKPVKYTWQADRFWLLKHNGQHWEKYRSFKF